MNATNKLTWLVVLGLTAGCAIQKAQRIKSDRLARKAAGECSFERSHPHMRDEVRPGRTNPV